MSRRLPPAWSAEELPAPWFIEEQEESFIVTDAKGQRLSFVYFEPDAGNETRRSVMNRPTHEGARRIAVNIAKLPTFLDGGQEPRNANDEHKS